MNIDVAVEILRSLAQGVNPLSDEELPYDSVCNEVEVVRALYCVIEELESTGIVTKKKLRRPRKARSREEKNRTIKNLLSLSVYTHQIKSIVFGVLKKMMICVVCTMKDIPLKICRNISVVTKMKSSLG